MLLLDNCKTQKQHPLTVADLPIPPSFSHGISFNELMKITSNGKNNNDNKLDYSSQ